MATFKWLAIVLMVGFASGCTFTQQAVKITPQVEVSGAQVGNGAPVRVNVVDERPKTTLGTRGAQGVGADMTVEGDLAAIVRNAIEGGLARLGFSPTQDPAEERELRVEIRNLDYNVIVGFWAGTLKVDCSMKSVCVRNGGRPYELLHRGEFTESVQVVQGAEANNHYVSEAVSDAVNSLLADRELMQCLAE